MFSKRLYGCEEDYVGSMRKAGKSKPQYAVGGRIFVRRLKNGLNVKIEEEKSLQNGMETKRM